MRVSRKIILPMFLVWYLIISEVFTAAISHDVLIFQYADEIITIVILLNLALKGSKRQINKSDRSCLTYLLLIVIVGISSNILFDLQNNYFAVFVDVISVTKVVICFIGIQYLVDRKTAKTVISSLVVISKALLILGLPFGVISQFYDIGMRNQFRFGVWGFNFIFDFAHIYSLMILVSLISIVASEKKEKTIFRYILLAAVEMIMTTKGPSIIWSVSILLFTYYFRKHKKVNIWLVIGLAILCVLLGWFQITEYFLKSNAPRALFYKYGWETGIKYFPLGSGFATFGSDSAAKYYSPLYYTYGFNIRYGMSATDTSFLNDNYWPMIFGQLGIIGLLSIIAIYTRFYKRIQSTQMSRMTKAIVVSSFFYIMLHSLGSATLTSSAGVILMIMISLVLSIWKNEDIHQNKKNTGGIINDLRKT